MPRRPALAAGLALGSVLDDLVRDPQRGHPVAVFGSWAQRHENAVYADSAIEGTGFLLSSVAPVALLGRRLSRRARRRLGGSTALSAVATWTVLGGAGL